MPEQNNQSQADRFRELEKSHARTLERDMANLREIVKSQLDQKLQQMSMQKDKTPYRS